MVRQPGQPPNRRRIAVALLLVIAVVLLLAWATRTPPLQALPSTSPSSVAAATGGVASGAGATLGSPSAPSARPAAAGQSTAPRSAEPGNTAAGGAVSLAALLARLQVVPEQRAGYERTLFVHWIDADGNGCDTRHEVLIAEAIVAPSVGPGCTLTGGRWHSLYDGMETTDAGSLDIDHVVPLAEAWDSGASSWSADRRKAYANDLGVPWALIAVSAASNRAKGDQDPHDWLPPLAAVRCEYTAMWLEVKVRWSLGVDEVERSTLAGLIAACPATLGEVTPAQ